ncbi:Hypothetical protein A7982_04895 [Minicystis rosea]|nr:Hypothetical protein A7982_04895 [Minicystis rosea]
MGRSLRRSGICARPQTSMRARTRRSVLEPAPSPRFPVRTPWALPRTAFTPSRRVLRCRQARRRSGHPS